MTGCDLWQGDQDAVIGLCGLNIGLWGRWPVCHSLPTPCLKGLVLPPDSHCAALACHLQYSYRGSLGGLFVGSLPTDRPLLVCLLTKHTREGATKAQSLLGVTYKLRQTGAGGMQLGATGCLAVSMRSGCLKG